MLALVVILWLGMAITGVGLAQRKESSPIEAIALVVLLGPIGLLILAFRKPNMTVNRTCPACLSVVPNAASACSHCGRDLPAAALA